MIILTLLVLILLLPSQLSAQKEGYNWYFGKNAAISFNKTTACISPPCPKNDSKIDTWEGCATISDKDGNLLFYTDGVYVWNRFHKVMPNGNGLAGHPSSTCSAVIIPKPNDSTKSIYYIFTADESPFFNPPNNGISYSIVDMSMCEDSGDVVQKNIFLYAPSTEKIAAVKHCNNKDFFIITHEYDNNRFRTYRVTEDGVIRTPIYSRVGLDHGGNLLAYMGQIKVAPDSRHIAVALPNQWSFQIFDFDNTTGAITNPVTLTLSPLQQTYGIEFSQDGSKFYGSATTTAYDESFIYQWDLSAGNNTQIDNSKVRIAYDPLNSNSFYAMQIGPNGKIYVAGDNKNYLGVIRYPNLKGTACYYEFAGLPLTKGYSQLGLPTFVSNYFAAPVTISGSKNCICEGQPVTFTLNKIENSEYRWEAPGGFFLTTKDTTLTFKNPLPGTYKVTTFVFGCETTIDTFDLTIVPYPVADITTDKQPIICKGDWITMTTPYDENYEYEWTTVYERKNTIRDNPPVSKWYYLTVTNECDCVSRDSIFIEVRENPTVSITTEGEFPICEGDTIALIANPSETVSYHWTRDGEEIPDSSNQRYYATRSGFYQIDVQTDVGCTAKDTITLVFKETPNSIIATDKESYCDGDVAELSIVPDDGTYSYLWSNGATTSNIQVTESGIYSVEITNASLCTQYIEKDIIFYPNPEADILPEGDTLIICNGTSIDITADKDFQSYLWSTGETTKTITVNQEGNYSLIATDSNGCSVSVNQYIKFLSVNFSNITSLVFDSVCISENNLKQFKLRNATHNHFSIDTIYLRENNENFKILSKLSNIDLSPDEAYTLEIEFSPKEIDVFSDSVIIEVTDPCLGRFAMSLTGTTKPTFLIWLPDTLTFIGNNNFCIPLMAKAVAKNSNMESANYSIEIAFNNNVFIPNDLDFEYSENKVKVKILVEDVVISADGQTLEMICGTVMLPAEIKSTVNIEEFSADKFDLCWTGIESTIETQDICVFPFRGIRLKIANSIQVNPNPIYASNTGSFSIILNAEEEGAFKLDIYSLEGKKIWENSVLNTKTSNQFVFQINTNIFNNGFYQIVLQSPSGSVNNPLVIIK